MKYLTLKVGDVRRAGDQVRSTNRTNSPNHPGDHSGKWRETDLVGFAIIPADLMTCELRRVVR